MSKPIRRALIVIDIQNEYVTGGLAIEYPPLVQSLHNVGKAMDEARKSGIPVVVVQNVAPATSPLFALGSEGVRLHDVVAGRQHDHFIEKTLPSAFAKTDLGNWIAEHGIDTLTVLGYMTHNCVDSTIKHALHAGLNVEFLHDASGSVPYANRAGQASAEAIHRTFSVVLQSRFAAVLSTDEWVAAITAHIEPERDTIHRSHARGVEVYSLPSKRAAASDRPEASTIAG